MPQIGVINLLRGDLRPRIPEYNAVPQAREDAVLLPSLKLPAGGRLIIQGTLACPMGTLAEILDARCCSSGGCRATVRRSCDC
jgi:hypothetical protein